MSKDKGTKNHKKAPADKSTSKSKAGSDYKNETKSSDKSNTVEATNNKAPGKSGGGSKA